MPVKNNPPRPLREVVRDFEIRGKRVTKSMAEEAIRAVAADGRISKDEVDLLKAYGDGSVSWKTDRDTWRQGSLAGRALFAGLSDTIETMYETAGRASGATPVARTNPLFWWATGWATPNPVTDPSVSRQGLIREVRARSVGWVTASATDLLRAYPKATGLVNSVSYTPKPEVKRAIETLQRDWLAGRVVDETDLTAPLKSLLETRFR